MHDAARVLGDQVNAAAPQLSAQIEAVPWLGRPPAASEKITLLVLVSLPRCSNGSFAFVPDALRVRSEHPRGAEWAIR
jgi:hypothetical protein